ncbi:uncharacterized protein PV09_03172 [Verruconis gallopava]|uniref:Heterokaryon incompatibility domain-containing protein n=1 Tax=Verruconis gallopava TaxID=253628 RepID=A0A0D2AGB7_9PEZI|nr:uncharacterized protein PV09_03172 [Verruconis gallopava]KIW05988.1 hypothetical protein PV09_03172 [Verruconis gallopava]
MEKWSPAIDPTYRKGQCEFFTWNWSLGTEFSEDLLSEHGNEAKEHLFREFLPAHQKELERGHRTLQRLREIHPIVASLVGTKPYLVDGMTLRLINGETSAMPKTYTALSYCWPMEPRRQTSTGRRPLPISPLLFQHLVLQRETADEGIWCDQICIDQVNKDEKSRTITAMDAIYRSARVVVVALEDIQVSTEEEIFLRAFIEDYEDRKWQPLPPPHIHERPPFMERNPVLMGFFLKICRSRWFQRAWCAHEMRLAKRHRFLIRCESDSHTLLSFSDFFMAYLVLLSASVSLPDEEKQVRHILNQVFNFSGYMDELRRVLVGSSNKEKEDGHYTLAWTTLISETFKLGAGGDPDAPDREKDANLDKMTIVLNSMGSGLALKRYAAAQSSRTASEELCQAVLFTLSLAAGDPTSLTTNGDPFKLATKECASWLRRPHHTDIGSGAMRQEKLPEMDPFFVKLDTSPYMKWIDLDFFVSSSLQEPPAELRSLAGLLVSECRKAGLGGGFLGQLAQGPLYLGWRMEADFEFWNINFTGIIAIFLLFGPKWMLGMAEKCGFASPHVLDEIKSAVRTHFSDGFDQNWLRDQEWTKSESSLHAVDCLLRIAYWLVGWSMSIMPQTHPDRWTWKPYICFSDQGFKAMILSPENMTVAVPLALWRMGYDRLPRVWLLDPNSEVEMTSNASDSGVGDEIAMRGKSVLFANLSNDDYSNLRRQGLCTRMRVHGPKQNSLEEN